MDILDIFFKKYSYKFPKGYPDMNNEQDINVLADLLENVGINLEEKEQISLDFPEENKDSSIFGKDIYEAFDGKIPPVKGTYKFDGNLEILSAQYSIVSSCLLNGVLAYRAKALPSIWGLISLQSSTINTGRFWNKSEKALLFTTGIHPKASASHVLWQSMPPPSGLTTKA
jgi:hypothetical protein